MRTVVAIALGLLGACTVPQTGGSDTPREAVRNLLVAELESQTGPRDGLVVAANCYVSRMNNTQIALFLDAMTDADRESVLNSVGDAATVEMCLTQAISI